MEAPVIVKVGGSLITRKSEPMSPDREAMSSVARSLSRVPRLVLVHGGGSFGHHVALARGLSSASSSGDASAASATRLAMHELSLMFMRELSAAGLRPFLFHASRPDSPEFWDSAASLARDLLELGATPLTHGDVGISAAGGFRVVGGDEISLRLAERLGPRRVVFLMDVPGVLRDPRDPSSVIEELDPGSARSLASRLSGSDATGGIAAKLSFAASIAELGTEVYLVSGRSAPDVLKAAAGGRPRGTLVRGH
ncbi:MAG: isopentenyl phosphate kinase [Conexivisphaera sp.]